MRLPREITEQSAFFNGPIESIALRDTTAWRKSAATRLQFARMQRAGRAWRLQNLRVKVYAPAENTYLHVPVQAVRRAAGALIPKQTFPVERTGAATVACARFRLIGYFDIYCHGRKLARKMYTSPLTNDRWY